MEKKKVFLALGSNLGDRKAAFRKALKGLKKGGLQAISLSPLHETEPEGCEDGAETFLNAVLSGFWEGTPQELLQLCQTLEEAAGRAKDHPHWHSRELDIDILLFGETILNTPHLTIPHPLAHTRSFVLQPLAELAPEIRFPTLGKTALQLWEEWKQINQ